MTGTVRVIIIAGIRLFREGLAQVLEQDGRVDVLGAAATVDEAIARADVTTPDILLLDMLGCGSVGAIGRIRETLPSVGVVALGVGETERDVLACAEAGAAAYVQRESSLDELVVTLTGAARGELRCSPRMAGVLMRRVARLAADLPETGDPRLTRRELEVVRLIDEGFTNKEIASRLFIEIATVKNHVHNILEKLGARSRGEAAARARRWWQLGPRPSGPTLLRH